MTKSDSASGPTAVQWHRAIAPYGGACPVCRRPLTIREDKLGAFVTGCDHVEDLEQRVLEAAADGRLDGEPPA